MSDKRIVLTFSVKTGEAQIEAKGFKGSGCTDTTKFLKDALGGDAETSLKAEYYEHNLDTVGVLNTQTCG